MASLSWSDLTPVLAQESIARRLARWSRLAGGYGVGGENGLTGLIALVVLPAAFAASLASSLPLAIPAALATINLSMAGGRAGAPGRAALARLSLAIALALVAVYFAALALNGAAMIAALAGVVLSLAFAALPFALGNLMAGNRDDGAALSRDVAGLDRLAPDERLVVVERGGRVAALSRAAMRQFAASGLKPGADILHLFELPDRPMLLDALDRAGPREQDIVLRLNGDRCPGEPAATPMNLSLVAIDAQNIIVRLRDLPPALPDAEQPCQAMPADARSSDSVAGEGACDLEDAVGFAIRLLAHDADRHGVRLTRKERPCSQTTPALPVDCSARSVRQIALNLIGNAIKFSHAGGLVTVETGMDDENGLLCVRDEGVGIAERDRGGLFCPHQRGGDHGRSGSGLGLAIVVDLIAGCGGRISIESTPGKGTNVTVQLPAAGMDGEARPIDSHPNRSQSREIARAA
jgi:signal transduction histidine kinase